MGNERTTVSDAVRNRGVMANAFEKENKTDFEKRFEKQTEKLQEEVKTMKNAELQFDDIVEKNKEVENNAMGYMSAIGKNKPDIVSRWEKQTENWSIRKTKDDYSEYLKNNANAKNENINVKKDVEWKNNIVKQMGSSSWEDLLGKLNEGEEGYIKSIDTSQMTEVGKKYVKQMKSAVEARKKLVKSVREYDGYKESTEFLGGVTELKTTDGKRWGYVSGKALDAIRENNLENYTPVSASERKVLEEYERKTVGFTSAELKKRVEELSAIPAEEYVCNDKNTAELEVVALSRVYSARELAIIKKNTQKANKKEVNDTYSIFDKAIDLVSEPISFLGGSDAYLKNSARIAERQDASDEAKKKASEREDVVSSAMNKTAREKTEKVKDAIDWEENTTLTDEDKLAVTSVNAPWTQEGYIESKMKYGDDENKLLSYLTDDEKKVMIYLIKKGQTDEARAYFDAIKDDVLQERSEQRETETRLFATNHPILANVGTLVAAPIQGLKDAGDLVEDAVDGLVGNSYGTFNLNDERFDYERDRAVISEVTNEKIDNPVGKFMCDVVLSSAENVLRSGSATLAGGLIGGPEGAAIGAKASLGLMGTKVYQSGVYDATQRGASKEAAVWYGITSAGVEIMTEKIGIDNLLDVMDDAVVHGSKAIIKNLPKQMAAEGTEEFISGVLEPIYDDMIMGENSHFNIRVRELCDAGMEKDDARKQAFMEECGEILSGTAAGAISGGVLSLGGTIVPTLNMKMQGEKIVKNGKVESVIAEGMKQPENTLQYRLAKELGEKMKQNAKLTNIEVGRLDYANHIALIEDDGFENETKNITEEKKTSSVETETEAEKTGAKMAETGNIETLKKATDMVIESIGNGAWSEKKETAYQNAVNDLETLKTNADSAEYKAVVEECISKLHDGYVSANYGTVMSIESAVERAIENTKALISEHDSAKRVEAVDDIEEEIKKSIKKRADLEQIKKLTKSGFSVKFFASSDSGINGVTIGKDVYVNLDGKKSIKHTIGHEFVHILKKNNKASYDSYVEAVKKTIADKTRGELYEKYSERYDKVYHDWSEKTFWEEYAADVAGDLAEDVTFGKNLIDAIAKENIGAEEKKRSLRAIEETLRGLITKIRVAWRKKTGQFGVGEAAVYEKNLMEVHRELLRAYSALTVDNAGAGGMKWSISKNVSITTDDVKAIQAIQGNKVGHQGKSVNEFTSQDIKATEAFAKKYWVELKEKSPFFRAWFGDWRAFDTTSVKIVKNKRSQRGIEKNRDTGWDIQISGKVFNETKTHRKEPNVKAKPFMKYINEIVQNAVLLDSRTIPAEHTKSPNSVMMHSLYAIADIGNGKEVIKLYVEELNDVNGDGTISRAYQLQNIKNQQLSAKGSRDISLAQSFSTADTVTIADLFGIVKQNDKNFHPNPSSVVRNENGTPKVVYHGTSDSFTEFKHSKLRGVEGSFFFAQNREDAEGYSGNGNVMEVYLNMKNPIDYNNMPSEIYKLPNKKAQVEVLKNMGYDGWYADLEDGWGEYSVFESEQIKSATDNIGTFDKKKLDIRFSLSENKKASEAVDSNNQNDIINNTRERNYIKEMNDNATRNITGGTDGISVEHRNKIGRSDVDFENIPLRNSESTAEKIYRNENERWVASEGGNRGSLVRHMDSIGEAKSFSIGQTSYERAFSKAVENGEREVARKILNEYAEKNGFEPITVYHGTQAEEPFTVFKNDGTANWISTTAAYSHRYSTEYNGNNPLAKQLYTTENSSVYELYIKKGKILDLGDINKVAETPQDIMNFAKKIGFTDKEIMKCWNAGRVQESHQIWTMSVTKEFADIARSYGYDTLRATERDGVETFGVLYPENIKSAKIETFDNQGRLIPIKKRFDVSSDDIRFSQGEKTTKQTFEEEVKETEKDILEKLEDRLGKQISARTKKAVREYVTNRAIEKLDNGERTEDSLTKLMEQIDNEAVYEDDVEDDGFLAHLKGVEKVYVSKDARQDVTVGDLSRTFGVGRWSGKEGLPVDVLYDEMVESGIPLPKADAIQDKLIAIIDKKEAVSNKRRVRLPRDEVREIIEYAVDLSDYKTSGTSEDREIPEKSGGGRSAIDEEFKAKRRELSEKMEKLGDEDLDERLRLKKEKEAIEDDFVAGWIKDGKTKNIRDVTMDFCTMQEADEAIAIARLKRTSDAAAEAEQYAKENKVTQGMKSVAKEMARGIVTENEINIKYRNAADRVKIKELSELYKRMSYTKADLKKEQRDTMYEVCDILMRNSEYMRDITSVQGQIDSFENIVDYICRVDSLKDTVWSKEIPEDVRKKLLKDAERLNEVFFNPIQKNTEAMNAWKKRYMEKLSEIGIEKRSAESAAAQALGENFYNKDDLYRAKFSETQIEKIEELAKFLKEMYKEILPKINEVRFSQGEEDIQNPKFKVNRQLKSIITKMHRDVQYLKHNEKAVKNLSESQIEDYAKRNDLSINAMKAFRTYPMGEFEKHIDWRSEQSTKSMGDMAQWAWNLLQSGKAYDRKKGTIEMDYFPHMEKSDTQNEILHLLNLKKTIDKLPTAISGMTEMFRPNKKWSAFMQERLGNETEFDAATGAERYLDSMGMYLYHASDITKIRILENFVREKYGKSGGDKFQLSNFAKYLREYGNNLAGKQHIIDRAFQDTFVGRRMAQWYRMVMNNVSRNQLAGNISTAMSNAALYGQGVSWVIREAVYAEDTSYLAKIFTKMDKREEHIAKSTFLSNRFSDDIRLKDKSRFYNSIAFVNEKLFAPAQIVDKVIATRVHQMMTAVYVSQGMSEADAIENADIELRRLAASREYGESPILFSSKTLGVMTKYTLEPLNQMRYYKNQFGRLTKAVLVGDDDKLKAGLKEAVELMVTLAADMVIMHLVNWGFKKVKGYQVVTDPIQMGMDAFDSIKEGDVSGAWLDALDEVPIVSNIMKASQGEVTDLVMIGDLINFVSSLCTMASSDADWGEIAYNIGMIVNPFGGVAQVKKMCQAVLYLKKGYWEKNGNVQYATNANAWDWMVGLLFGKSAIPSVQEYYNNYTKLSENNSDAFKTILDLYPIEPEELFDMMMEYQELVKEAKKENETYELHTWITEELDKWKKDDGDWNVYDKYYIWNIMKGRKCDVPERFNEAERKIAEIFIETGDTSVLIDEMSDSFSISGYGKTTVYQLGEEDVLSLQGEYEKILSSKIMKDYKAIRNSGSMSTERWVECIKNAKKKSSDEAKEAAVANGWYEGKTEETIENADYFAIMHRDIQKEKMSEVEAFYLYLDAKGKEYVMPDWQNATDAQEKLAKIFASCEEEPEDFLPTNKTNTFNNDKKTYVLNEEQHEKLKKLHLDYYWEQIANMPEMSLDDTLACVKKARKGASEYAKSCILSEYGDALVIRE